MKIKKRRIIHSKNACFPSEILRYSDEVIPSVDAPTEWENETHTHRERKREKRQNDVSINHVISYVINTI